MGTFNSLQYKELVVPIIWQVYLEETKCGDATTQTLNSNIVIHWAIMVMVTEMLEWKC